MNKLKLSLIVFCAVIGTTTYVQAASADGQKECFFTPNEAFCIEERPAHQAWTTPEEESDAALNMIEATILEEVIATVAIEQLQLEALQNIMGTLQEDNARRAAEIDGSRDVFRNEIYTDLNRRTQDTLDVLKRQHRLTALVTHGEAQAVIRLLNKYHEESIALEELFKKSHRAESKKKKIREALNDLEKFIYQIESFSNDAYSAYRKETGLPPQRR